MRKSYYIQLFLLNALLATLAACGSSQKKEETLPKGPGVDGLSQPVQKAQVNEPPLRSHEVKQGEEFLASKDPAQARRLFEKALSKDETDARAHFDLALALEMLEERETAQTHYLNALEYAPRFVQAMNNLGLMYRDSQRLEEARTLFAAAAAIEPMNADVQLNWALTLEELGERAHAERAYRQAIRIDANLVSARVNLAVLLARRGEVKQSKEQLDAALPLALRNRAFLAVIGATYRQIGEPKPAIASLKDAIKAGQGKPTASLLNELALAYVANSQPVEAEKAIKEAIKLEASFSMSYYILGSVLATKRDYAGAQTAFEHFIKLEPEGPIRVKAEEKLAKIRRILYKSE